MSNSLFNPEKYGFKQPMTDAAFKKKYGRKELDKKMTNPCDREKLIAGLKEAQGK